MTTNMNYYHIGTFETREECMFELKKATALVTSKDEAVACLDLRGHNGKKWNNQK